MKPEIAKKWIEALRSGNYKQGRHYLHQNDGSMCCLGVLCDLAFKEGVTERDGGGYVNSQYYYNNSSTVLPESVKKWAGMCSTNGFYLNKSDSGSEFSVRAGNRPLSTLNDRGKNFSEIADIIEKYLEDL